MTFKIESNVPPPSGDSGRPAKYPWAEMKVGDSFRFDGAPGVRDRISASSRAFAKRNAGVAFVTRREGDGYRIWRIAAPASKASTVIRTKFAGGSK